MNYRTDRTDDGRTGGAGPPPYFRLRRYARRIFRQKSSNDQKIARMARILMIFGPFEARRRQLQFPKILNERKINKLSNRSNRSTRSSDRAIDRIDRRPPWWPLASPQFCRSGHIVRSPLLDHHSHSRCVSKSRLTTRQRAGC